MNTTLRRAAAAAVSLALAAPAPADAQLRAAVRPAAALQGLTGAPVVSAPALSLPSLAAPAVPAAPSGVAGFATTAAGAISVLTPALAPASLSPAQITVTRPAPAAAPSFSPAARAFAVADEVLPHFAAAKPESDAPRAAAPARSAAPLKRAGKDGVERALSYDPAAPRPGVLRAAWTALTGIPEKLRRVRAYMARVRELTAGVTDEQLWWSLNRLKALETQEGILRADNRALVNPWDRAASGVRALSPSEYDRASLSRESLMKIFKTAMDLEEPTLQYQFAFAQNLHNRLHRLSHFLGTTLQERILAVALRGRAAPISIWAAEEVRHGPILERVYNAVREPGAPALVQEGEAPRLPRHDAAYLALSGMSNRSLAEISAGTAYLALIANAPKDGAVERALDGLYRDEVYHYVIMALVNRHVYGQGRLERLYRIFRHDLDYRPVKPTDKVLHRRPFVSPLVIFEIAYAFLKIDARVSRFLRERVDRAKAADLLGETYATDAQLEAALARGAQTRTRFFRMEQNPELSREEVETLARRLPGWIDASERKIKASEIRGVIAEYRGSLLSREDYWLKRKGFARAAEGVLARPLANTPGATLALNFGAHGGPRASLATPEGVVWSAPFSALTMRQFGALMDAEDAPGLLAALKAGETDLSPSEIMARVGRGEAYKKEPIPVVED